jgi:hypothetical protein
LNAALERDPRTTERKGDVCACRFESMVRTSSSMCGCREGSNFIAGRGCVPRIACRGGRIPNAAGTDCVCRAGLVLRQGKCVEPVSCRAPAKLNRAGTDCICPEGMTKRGNTCVEQRTPQITIPRGVPGIGFPGGGGDKRGPQGGGGEGPRGVR